MEFQFSGRINADLTTSEVKERIEHKLSELGTISDLYVGEGAPTPPLEPPPQEGAPVPPIEPTS